MLPTVVHEIAPRLEPIDGPLQSSQRVVVVHVVPQVERGAELDRGDAGLGGRLEHRGEVARIEIREALLVLRAPVHPRVPHVRRERQGDLHLPPYGSRSRLVLMPWTGRSHSGMSVSRPNVYVRNALLP